MGNKGSFKSGNVPWNKNKKGIHLSPDSEFKEGQMVGKEHYSWKGGVQKPKNDCRHLYTGPNQRVRRPVFVYEKHHGKIPTNWVIIHLDSNKNNDEIENLIAIPRAILIKLNANRILLQREVIENEIINYLKMKINE